MLKPKLLGLIKCPKCNKEYSDKLTECSFCKERKFKKLLLKL